MEISKLAMIVHEANRAYCIAIGDSSQPRWEDAPEWQRESAIKGIEFRRKNPQATAATMHQSWLDGADWAKAHLGVPRKVRQELVTALWKLGFDCNRLVDECTREQLIRCLIITAENRDDWRKQANGARVELDAANKAREALSILGEKP